MKKHPTTERQILAAQPGRYYYGRGLCLIVTTAGPRWIYRFTSPATKRVSETSIGSALVFSYPEAHNEAVRLHGLVARGKDPVQDKREKRAVGITFKQVCEEWIATHRPAWKGDSQLRNAETLLQDHGAALAQKPVSEITPDMVEAALKPLWQEHPLQGRRALAMWARVFDFAKAKGYRSGDNPASWRGCHEYRFARARKEDHGHYRALDYVQFPDFMQQLRMKQNHSAGAMVLEFAILTCVRSGEALGAKWGEIDLEKRLWTIPKERMKAGKEHTVPLSDRAMAILALQQQYSSSDLVFTGRDHAQLTGNAMRAVLKIMNVQSSVHGFRSSFRDWAGDVTDFARENIEACLAHQVGSAVEQAYRRKDGLEKRREIMEAWARYCASQS
jgi:integrase